ncbi:MAG TPA: hypothetical protein VG820_03435 [Fimbriimonadaceae bacterium]|nr:hypothetical protein [Fimbriimonadaceae bacterium]
MLYLLAQDTLPTDASIVDILLWPVAVTILAWIIFYAGWWVENRLMKAPWKWLAVLPVAYGIYIGIDDVIKISDPFYRSAVGVGAMKKMIAAHYGALIIPVLGLAGIILFHFFNHKLNLPTDED